MARRPKAGARIAAATVAITVHVALFAALLTTGDAIKRGLPVGDEGAAMSVSLVHFSSSGEAATATQDTELDRLELLQSQLTQGAEPAPSIQARQPRRDTTELLQAFDAHKKSGQAATSQAAGGAASRGETLNDPFAQASISTDRLKTPAPANVWAQVRRCWRPSQTKFAVRLAVSLDEHGALRSPPLVIRDGPQQVDRARIDAESEAIRAVIVCAPYLTAGLHSGSFDMEFSSQ